MALHPLSFGVFPSLPAARVSPRVVAFVQVDISVFTHSRRRLYRCHFATFQSRPPPSPMVAYHHDSSRLCSGVTSSHSASSVRILLPTRSSSARSIMSHHASTIVTSALKVACVRDFQTRKKRMHSES
jgi:hypothetical protein